MGDGLSMVSSVSEFLVIVEAPADYKTATQIAEKTISEFGPEWLKEVVESQKSSLFSWTGLENNTSFSCWGNIEKIEMQFKQEGYWQTRALGHDDKPFSLDYPRARKVLLLVMYLNNKRQGNIDAILFIRDADSRSQAQERLKSIEAVRDKSNDQKIPAIVGFAIPKREAWVLNGFEPKDDSEMEQLKQIKKEIQMDPCKEPHRLRGKKSQPGTETRDIKSVLEKLTKNNRSREEECWQNTPLSVLYDCGKETGLTGYIDEVRDYLLPALTGSH